MLRAPVAVVDRYRIHDAIASGGMATVHLARLAGEAGFSRVFAAKRLHPHLAADPEIALMLADEARMMSHIRHANVVSVVDVVALQDELLIVMEYIPGASLSRALREARDSRQPVPPAVAVAIVAGVLRGLQAAHEATDEHGDPLGIIHRDVSPQNVLVGTDGIARVLDFGVARATGRLLATRSGWKGKAAYMAPEQLQDEELGPSADVWGASVVLWEALTGHRLFAGESDYAVSLRVVDKIIDPPGRIVSGIPRELDAVVMGGLERDSSDRFASAREMVAELEAACAPASADDVRAWLDGLLGCELRERSRLIQRLERADGEQDEISSVEAPATAQSVGQTPSRMRRAAPKIGVGVVGLALLAWIVVVTGGSSPFVRPSVDVEPKQPVPSFAGTPPRPESAVTKWVEDPPEEEPVPAVPVDKPTARSEPRRAPPNKRPVKEPTPSAPSSAAQPKTSSPSRLCDPPYVVDAEGFQHLKPECL